MIGRFLNSDEMNEDSNWIQIKWQNLTKVLLCSSQLGLVLRGNSSHLCIFFYFFIFSNRFTHQMHIELLVHLSLHALVSLSDYLNL